MEEMLAGKLMDEPWATFLPCGIICLKQDKSCQSRHWLHLSLKIRETCPLRKARLAWARGVLQDLRGRLSSQKPGCPFNQPFISGAWSADSWHPLSVLSLWGLTESGPEMQMEVWKSSGSVYQYPLVYHGGWQPGMEKEKAGERNEGKEKGRNEEKEGRISESFTLLS